jgi:hypothetical protein
MSMLLLYWYGSERLSSLCQTVEESMGVAKRIALRVDAKKGTRPEDGVRRENERMSSRRLQGAKQNRIAVEPEACGGSTNVHPAYEKAIWQSGLKLKRGKRGTRFWTCPRHDL